jgi:hypothetical protein
LDFLSENCIQKKPLNRLMNRLSTNHVSNLKKSILSVTFFRLKWGRMRQNGIIIISLTAILFFGSGCASEPGIDKGKFSELNRTARDLKSAITSGEPCDIPDTLLQRLVSGTTALKGKTTSQGESDLLAAYSNLVTTYQDGLLLCKYRTHLSRFQFVPRGRIYVFQELDPLIQKYDFSTERHVYKPTGLHWRSIAGDSINVIWENAKFQTKNIENMENYN